MVRTTFVIGLLLALAGAAGTFVFVQTMAEGLPDIQAIQDYQPRETTYIYDSEGNVLAAMVGEDAIHRTVLTYDEMPQVMRDAMVAAEDAEFYNHEGLDYVGLARAVYTNIRRGELSQGASTITQQVVKNLILTPERSIRRKVQEALLAFRLEDNLTKDEILTIYLNEIFFGVRYYGIEEASLYYFGHGASELSLPEAALLAGLVQSPNRYNPFEHPDRALSRRSYVLRQMWEKGFIEEGQYREADEAPLELAEGNRRGPYEGRFPYYVDAVRRQLLEQFPEELVYGGGLRVHTALSPELQAAAEESVQAGLRGFDSRHGFHMPYDEVEDAADYSAWRMDHAGDVTSSGLRAGEEYRGLIVESNDERTVMGIGPYLVMLSREPESRMRPDERPWEEILPVGAAFTVTPIASRPASELSRDEPVGTVRFLPSAQAAAVVIDASTRDVLALVGGYDFEESSFNRAVQAARQVGSSFKPFVYGAALEARVSTPATVYQDQPTPFRMHGGEVWSPRNYDGDYDGPMSLRTALARSRNVIAVRVLDQVGLEAATDFARNAGLESELTDNLTLALGSAEIPPMEMTNAFATFANGGIYADPVLITRVENGVGEVLYQPERDAERRLDEDVVWLLASMMRSVVEEGTARRARDVGVPVAGKTGTTNELRDAWFVGFSPAFVTGVWVGRDDNTTLGRGESGGGTALPIWTDLMTRAHVGVDGVTWPEPPEGIVEARIDPSTGLLARPGQEDARTEYFLAGTEPREVAPSETDRSIQDVLLDPSRGTESGEGEESSGDVNDGDYDGF